MTKPNQKYRFKKPSSQILAQIKNNADLQEAYSDAIALWHDMIVELAGEPFHARFTLAENTNRLSNLAKIHPILSSHIQANTKIALALHKQEENAPLLAQTFLNDLLETDDEALSSEDISLVLAKQTPAATTTKPTRTRDKKPNQLVNGEKLLAGRPSRWHLRRPKTL